MLVRIDGCCINTSVKIGNSFVQESKAKQCYVWFWLGNAIAVREVFHNRLLSKEQ